MKKTLGVAACAILLCHLTNGFLPSAYTEMSSLQFYNAAFVLTTESDWTTLQISGCTFFNVVYAVRDGGETPGLSISKDAQLSIVGISKKQFDTTPVALEVKAILHVEREVTFTIKKGNIGYTTLHVYNCNKERSLVQTFTNNEDTSDPENPRAFTLPPEFLTEGGPLPPLTRQLPRLVWAFYYPWYFEDQWYTDPALIDTPAIGPYSSSDPSVIETHIKQAQSSGIDGFIVSWWGENSETDQNLEVLLDIAEEYDFKITIYLESLADGPRSERELKEMLLSFFRKYGDDQRYYRIDGIPVIFVWAANSHEPSVWANIFADAERKGYIAVYIAETAGPSYLEAFDGLHIYGTIGFPDLPQMYEHLSIACKTYGYLSGTNAPYLWAATLCPGCDDREIPGREGLYQSRENGDYYRKTGEAALNSAPDWLVITSFNEWYENTHVEPSLSYGTTYLELTSLFSAQFKALPKEAEPPATEKKEASEEKESEKEDEEEKTPEEKSLEEADRLFEEGKEAFEAEDYESALMFFQEARKMYERWGSEKVKECDVWIEKTRKEMNRGFCSGTLVMAGLVGLGLLRTGIFSFRRRR